MKPEELLTHADFVRSLAGRLVADENASADIAQQACLAALEQPQASIRSPRSWLSRVVRNFAHMMRRSEVRRRDRENACARPDRIPSTADIVQREETRRKVVDAVLNLEEPYRSAVVLRFYEDLAPGEVAETLGVSLETARSRIKRGLARLRQSLDKEFGGRRVWSAALLPLAGLKLATTKAAISATASAVSAGASQGIAANSALYGGLVMATKTKIVVAATLILAATLTIWQIVPNSDEALDLGVAAEETHLSRDSQDQARVQAEIVDSADPEENLLPVAIEPEGTPFSGRVIEKDSGDPVRRFEIELSRFENSMGERVWHEKTEVVVQDPEGSFDLRIPRGGIFSLRVHSTCHVAKGVRDLEIPDGSGLTGYEVKLDVGHVLSGLVLDDATDNPVTGAVVSAARQCSPDMIWPLRGRKDRFTHTVTDEEGRFTLKGFPIGSAFWNRQPSLAAVHPDFAEGWEVIAPGVTEFVEIRLKRGFSIFGTVLDDGGRPVEGLMIRVWADNIPLWIYAATGPDGRFRTTPVGPGIVEVEAKIPFGKDESDFNFSTETRHVQIIDNDVEVDFGPRKEHVTWHGALYNHTGDPEPGVRLHLARENPDRLNNPGVPYEPLISATSDEQGRFEFKKLLPGTYRLQCKLEGDFLSSHTETVVLDTPGELKKDLNLPADKTDEGDEDDHTGAICGIVLDGSTNAPLKPDQRVTIMALGTSPGSHHKADYDGTGGFRVDHLPAGTYDLRVSVEGLPAKDVRGIRLSSGQVINDLTVVVPRGGTLCVKLAGFRETGPRRFRLLSRHGDGTRIPGGTINLDATGQWEMTQVREVGQWTYRVEFEGLGYAEKQADVIAGRTAEILFSPGDLVEPIPDEDRAGTTTVTGSLTQADGAPLPGYFLLFYPIRVDGLEADRLFASAETDSEGLFSLSGFKPGFWRASVYPSKNRKPVKDREFVIPKKGSDPYALRLTMPAGSVHGTLCSRSTGQPLPGEWSECEILVLVSDTHYVCRNLIRPEKGSFFVAGIPEGDYRLAVRAPGFWPYDGAWFSHSGTGDLDLGTVLLEPRGLLKLKVTGSQGQAISKYYVFCNGARQFLKKKSTDSAGYWMLERMPPGRARIEIKAVGFRSWDRAVDIAPGEPTVLDVFLEPYEAPR